METKPVAVVRGLVFRSYLSSDQGALAGPGVLATLGFRLLSEAPVRPELMVGEDVSPWEMDFLRHVVGQHGVLKVVESPTLRFKGESVMGAKIGRVEGRMHIFQYSEPVGAEVLVAANADPRCYVAAQDKKHHYAMFLDCYSEWIKFRRREISLLLRSAKLVSLTRAELALLEPHQRAWLMAEGAVILKNGAEGVLVSVRGRTAALPAPITTRPAMDVSAGDLLLGCISARLQPFAQDVVLENIVDAYESSLPVIARLLRATSLAKVLDELANGLHA